MASAAVSAAPSCLAYRLWQQKPTTCALTEYEATLPTAPPRPWSSSPELEEHAALLLPLCDHLEGVQAAVAPVAVPAAEGDERAVEAVVPGSILVHVPEAVLVCTHCKTDNSQNQKCFQINAMAMWSIFRNFYITIKLIRLLIIMLIFMWRYKTVIQANFDNNRNSLQALHIYCKNISNTYTTTKLDISIVLQELNGELRTFHECSRINVELILETKLGWPLCADKGRN